MAVRKAAAGDMPEIRRIYAAARQFMRETGNPHQWGNSHPDESLLVQDIAVGQLYLCEEAGRPYAAFAFIPGEDPTYRVIFQGAWLNDAPYAVLHRVAADGSHKGSLGEILAFCAQGKTDLRIDTHRDNRVMQHLLDRYGFTRCGIIHLLNGDERIAYQRVCTETVKGTDR